MLERFLFTKVTQDIQIDEILEELEAEIIQPKNEILKMHFRSQWRQKRWEF